MSIDPAVGAILCALFLPCTFFMALNPNQKMPGKGLYLLATCLLSGLLVWFLMACLLYTSPSPRDTR